MFPIFVCIQSGLQVEASMSIFFLFKLSTALSKVRRAGIQRYIQHTLFPKKPHFYLLLS